MATKTIKARVELDGEKQYKQALSELNSGNKVLASEMRKLQAEYKGNAESTEFLSKKSEVLQRQLLLQKEKVETLRQALQNAAEKYGEADKRTQAWAVQLNNAEAKQYDLEHAIEENENALNNQNTTMKGLGDTLDDVAGKLGIRIPESAKNALNGLKSFSAGTVAAVGAAAAGVAALVKVMKELHELTLEQAANADETLTDSLITGFSTETLQQLQYAENLIDVSSSTISSSLTKLTNSIYDANNGSEKLAETFELLGVATTNADGSLRSAQDVFYDVVDSLGEFGNETERDAIAMDILGKSAKDLNPLIIQGSDALRDLAEEAENVGYVLDESQIKKLGEVDDAYQRTQLQIEATKKMLAVEFAPASKEAMETFAEVVKKAGQILVDTKIIENLGAIVQGVAGIVSAVTNFTGKIPGWLNPIQNLSNQLKMLAQIAATVADAINLVSGIMPWNWGSGKAKTALGLNLGSGQMSYQQQLKYSSGDYTYYNATGNDNWRGGLTWVGESGPELVALPQGSKVFNAQDSRNIGGTTTINISVNGIQQLDEVVRWYDSRQVRGRMM